VRIFRRRHDDKPFAWESLPGVEPLPVLAEGVVAHASWRTLPTAEVVGLVQHRGRLGYALAVHEVTHLLRQVGNDGHHDRWHFCALVASSWWRWLPWRCSTPRERQAGRDLLICPDGHYIDT
jgi:hypothetical protein